MSTVNAPPLKHRDAQIRGWSIVISASTETYPPPPTAMDVTDWPDRLPLAKQGNEKRGAEKLSDLWQ